MWYVILLAFGIWNSCIAMDDDSHDSSSDNESSLMVLHQKTLRSLQSLQETVDTFSREVAEGKKLTALSLAISYHTDHLSEGCDCKDVHAQSLEYLNTIGSDEKEMSEIWDALKNAVIDKSKFAIVHKRAKANSLVLISLNEDKKREPLVLKPNDEDEKANFMICTVSGNADISSVLAIDDKGIRHYWTALMDSPESALWYNKYAEQIPRNKAAIREMGKYTAYLFSQQKHSDHVAWLKQWADYALMPVNENDTQAKMNEKYYRIVNSNGYSIYCADREEFECTEIAE